MQRSVLVLLMLSFAPSLAQAEWIRITDVSLLRYQTGGDGRVFLRNLKDFDSRALDCCYSYWIDTTTIEGKLIWPLLVSLAAQGKGLSVRVPDGFASGAVNNVGEW